MIRSPSTALLSLSSSTIFAELFSSLNMHICRLFFRTVLEISGEISDQLLKSARSFIPERHVRDSKVRDLVREKDARGLNDAVVGILSECLTKLSQVGSNYDQFKAEITQVEDVVDWGVRAFASYIRNDIPLSAMPN